MENFKNSRKFYLTDGNRFRHRFGFDERQNRTFRLFYEVKNVLTLKFTF